MAKKRKALIFYMYNLLCIWLLLLNCFQKLYIKLLDLALNRRLVFNVYFYYLFGLAIFYYYSLKINYLLKIHILLSS